MTAGERFVGGGREQSSPELRHALQEPMRFAIAIAAWSTALPTVGGCQTAVPVRPEAGVYALVLKERFHGGLAAQMRVSDKTIAMPSGTRGAFGGPAEPFPPEVHLRRFDDLPIELREAVRQSEPTKRITLDISLLPAGQRIVSDQVDGRLELSDVIFTADRLDALVYAELVCRGLCGEAAYFWMRRKTLDSPWVLAKRIGNGVS